MSSGPLRHRSFVRRALDLEQLQQRDLLAGNVSAFVDRGTLIVNGDIGDNELRITQVGKDMVQLTSMSSPTTINNQLSVATFKVTKGMIFNMGGGNDVLQFDGITMKQKNDLVVNMGVGDDNLQFNNVNVTRIRAMLGQGHDSATVTNSKVSRSLNIFGETGDEQFTLSNSKFGDKSVIDGNAGANFLNQSNVKFGRKLQSLNLTFGTRPAVTPPATTPIDANDDSFTIAENGTLENFNPLSNDTATTGATLTPSSISVTQPSNGTVTIQSDFTLRYVHNGSELTSDSFTYTIRDSSGATATATVNVTVTPVNDAPTAGNDEASVATGQTVRITVLTDDSDVDGSIDPASIVITSQPSSGSVIVNADGTISYTHNGTTTTTDNFAYTVKDNNGAVTATPAAVAITIVTNNAAPVANADPVTVAEAGTISIPVLNNDTDSDGTLNASTVAIVTQPANGTVTINANGTITYVHNGSELTTDSFTYTVRDNLGTVSNTATVTITVTPVNDPPTAANDSQTLVRGATAIIDVADNDDDAEGSLDLASIVIVTQPINGAVTVNNNGTVTYVHNNSATTTDSFTYTIKDSSGAVSTAATVNLTINAAANQAPVAENDAQTVAEGGTATVSVLANDEDPDAADTLDVATVTIVGQPGNGTVTVNANGTIGYVHNGSETITDTFTYTVKDNHGLVSNTATVTITITPVNDAPVAVADSANVGNGGTVSFSVSANDTDAENALDPTEVVIVAQPTNGTLTENNDGTVTYTHNGSATTSDSFTYNIKDQSGLVSNTVTVTITVGTTSNDPPEAVNDVANVNEGGTMNINVSANDTDDNDDLDLDSIVIVTQPTNGTVTVNNDGTVTYLHNGTETTSDSFTYTIKDSAGLTSNTATVNLTIVPVNDAPVAENDTATAAEGGTATVDISANDSDSDGDINVDSIAIVTQPLNGTVTVNGDGTITYLHNGGETTSDSFTYTINDNNGTVSNIATVNITVTPVNDAPTATGDSANVDEGASVDIPVSSNDVDPEDDLDLESIEITLQPANGTVTVNIDGTVTYQHNGSETTTDSFTYTIKDAQGLVSGTATVTITVAPLNDAPTAVNDSAAVTEDSGTPATGNVLTNDTDPDNVTLNVSAVDGVLANVGTDVAGQFGTFHINADGSYTYTLDDTNTTVNELDDLEEIIDSIAYTVSDGALTSIATLTVTIVGNTD